MHTHIGTAEYKTSDFGLPVIPIRRTCDTYMLMLIFNIIVYVVCLYFILALYLLLKYILNLRNIC